MATYNIIYKCGHTADKQLLGRIDERLRYIDWCKENRLCPACEKSFQADYRSEQSRHALEQAATLGLVDLQGTGKQIAWALTIRSKVIQLIEDFIQKAEKYTGRPDYAKYMEAWEGFESEVLSHDTAKFYIDNYKNVCSEDIREAFVVYCKQKGYMK